jgi:hypothetical protein
MDVTCPNCGAKNRATSRFCARCGESLPRTPENAEAEQVEGINLPWLQGVHDRAVKETGELSGQQLRAYEEQSAPAHEQPQGESAEPQQQPHEPGEQTPQATAPSTPATPATPTRPAPEPTPLRPTPEAAPTTDTGSPDTGPGGPGEPPPDWVAGILEPGARPQGEDEAAYEPEELEHIMPWLGEKPLAEGGLDALGRTPGLPPWLSGVTVQETIETRGGQPQTPDANLSGELEVEGIVPFVPPELQVGPLSLPGEEEVAQEPPASPAPPEQPPSKPKEEVPEWLKNFAPRIEDKEAAPKKGQGAGIDHTTPVTKVVLDSSDTLGQQVTTQVPVRPPRAGAVETLAALLQAPPGETSGQPVPGTVLFRGDAREVEARKPGLSARKWLFPDGIIYMSVLAALLAILLLKPPFGQVNAPAAADVLQFYNAVDAAPRDKPVLVVYDWDASRSAEMYSLSYAVTHHLMSRRLRFVTISTVPQGPGFAQEVTRSVAQDSKANYGYTYGSDYLVLGYLPGSEAALRSLTGNFSGILPLDYANNSRIDSYQIVRSGAMKSLDDFGLIIDLASDESALRNWIEQVATRTRVPLVAAVPQGLAPLARPYRNIEGVGLKAVVSGQVGALQYAQQLSLHNQTSAAMYSPAALNDRLNAQSVAQILVALAIIGALLSVGLAGIFRR